MEQTTEEIRSLRRCVRELAALSVLSAAWGHTKPQGIAESLVEVLLRSLPHVDYVYARVKTLSGEGFCEAALTSPSLAAAPDPQQIGTALESLLTKRYPDFTSVIPNPFGDGDVRLAMIPIGYEGDSGVLVACSPQSDFPSPTDKLLLQVASNQAAVVLQHHHSEEVLRQQSRLLHDERELLRAAQDRLREQGEWLQTTLTSIGDAVIATDTEGRIMFLNRVAEELTGWTQSDAEGRPLESVFAIFNELTRQPVANPVAKALQQRGIVGLGNHTILIAKDGVERPIDDSAAPIRDAAGEIIGVVLIFRDVTEHRRAEREVRASVARKSAILESALDSIITMDHEGKVIEFNPAAERTFGYQRKDVLGQNLADFIIPPAHREQHRNGLAHYLVSGEGPMLGKRIELSAMRVDGTEFPVEVAITRIPTEGPPIFTAYLRDITEQKKAEQHRNARLAVTQALSQATNVQDGVNGALGAVCECLGWDVGFYWTLNDEKKSLVCRQEWRGPEVPVTELITASHNFSFAKGEGLLGDVWAQGKPAWILDAALDARFSRAASAAKDGLHSAFACPVIVGDRTLGVIEFFTKRIREPDADLLEMMATMAGNVAQFIERKTAEAQVRQSEQEVRFQARLLDTVGQAVIVTKPDGTIIYWNCFAESLYGWSRDEALGQNVIETLAAPESKLQAAEVMQRLNSGQNWSGEFLVRRRNGTTFPAFVTDTPFFDEYGRVNAIIGISVDITDRKRLENSLRFLADASAALAAVVDYQSTLQKVASLAVPDFADWCAVDMAEPDGTLRRLAVAHLDQAQVRLAQELDERYPAKQDAPHGAYHVLCTGKSELMSEIPDSLFVQVATDEVHLGMLRELGLKSYMCVPLKVRGKVQGVITFATAESGRPYTASDLEFAEELSRRSAIAIENAQLYRELRDADRRKDEFLATLAHELRNPLAPIRTGLEVMKMVKDDPAVVEEVRSTIERQTQQLITLVDDLLDVSRITRGKLELRKCRVKLSEVVRNAVEASRPFIDELGHELTVAMPNESCNLNADPHRLAQVLSNLLNNAAKYTPEQGRIWLTAECQGSDVVLTVKDTGIGIPADMLDRIFEMFAQIERPLEKGYTGLGIGLTLVKSLVEMHNGSIEVHSEGNDQGSEFRVRLPILVDLPVQQARKVPSVEPPATASKRKVLVVDDNRAAADMLGIVVKMLGNDVRIASDGEEGVKMAAEFLPDVVLMDLGMPKMNGYEAAHYIRQQAWGQKVKLIALTGWGKNEDKQRTKEAGFDHHLVKPAEPAELQRLLEEFDGNSSSHT